nr:pyocin knob domain-containing protein [Providencia sneebia]
MTLSFPVPAATKNVPYNILTTMVNSVSDAANKIVAMNNANVQFSDILNRWMTETGTITVTLPDGTTQQLRTTKEQDRLLDGKFNKTGGDVGNITVKEQVTVGTTDVRVVLRTSENKPEILSRQKGAAYHNTHELPDKSGKLMQVGDFGLGAPQILTSNPKLSTVTSFGYWIQPYSAQATVDNEYPITEAGTLICMPTANNDTLQEYRSFSTPNIYYRKVKSDGSSVGVKWNMQYSTGNTTKDSNGNLKAASPIVKVFAESIETNDESEGVTMQKLGIGHYLIKGVVGFNADGAWGINNGFVIPQDHNGKNMVIIDYNVKEDGDIELFVFHQQNADMPERFQNNRIKHLDEDGQPIYFDNYEPCDVPDSRWIDMRVEMPVNSIYNIKKAESQRLAKIEAERVAKEEAEKAEREQYRLGENDALL